MGGWMYLLAPYDKVGGWKPSWTSPTCPEPVVVGWMKGLATSALERVDGWMEGGGEEGGWVEAIVPRSPFEVGGGGRYDVLIRFKKGVVGPLVSGPYGEGRKAWGEAKKGCKALRCGKLYKNLVGGQAEKRVVGFDPIQEYLGRLVKRYVSLYIIHPPTYLFIQSSIVYLAENLYCPTRLPFHQTPSTHLPTHL